MPNTSPIVGYVDGLSRDRMTFSGWLAVESNGGLPDVHCFRRDLDVGSAEPSKPRADVLAAGIDNRSFHIHLDDPVPLGAMLTGEYTFRDTTSGISLTPTTGFRARCQNELLKLIAVSHPATKTTCPPVIADPPRPNSSNDLSAIMFPVGVTSGDDAVQLGRGGFAFLVGGTAQLHEQYCKPKTPRMKAILDERLDRHMGAYQVRAEELASLGSRYRQMIVPEKSTLLPHLASMARPITPLLEELKKHLSSEKWYLSATKALAAMSEPELGWLRYSSRPAPAGVQRLTQALVESLGLESSSAQLSLDDVDFVQGDLSANLFGTRLWEPIASPSRESNVLSTDGAGPDENLSSERTGSIVVLKNNRAPHDLTAVIFSDFERDHTNDSQELSWWMAHEFREVHVVSAKQLDMGYVRKVGPDVVVCQTRERDLAVAAGDKPTNAPPRPDSSFATGVHPTTGFVERVSRNRRALFGWAAVYDDGTFPDLRCFRRGEQIGTATFGDVREDARASVGLDTREFVITLDHALPPGALFSGEYLVRDVASGYSLQLTMRLFNESESELLKITGLSEPGARETNGKEPVTKPRSLDDLAPVWFPVGLTSHDESATVGRNGYVFLTGGTNVVSERYREPTTRVQRRAVERSADAWASLFRSRKHTTEQLGAQYVQIVVPEKTTTLHHLIDLESPVTPLLQCLENCIDKESWYLSGRRIFESLRDPEDAWLRYDAHPGPGGSRAIMKELVRRLALPDSPVLTAPLIDVNFFEGDLSRRLFHVNLWDPHVAPANDETLDGGPAPDLIESRTPGVGKHVGSKRVWKRENASYRMKVVIFGDSTFGTGAHSAQLSWWASRLFQEVHFIWGNTLDRDYLIKIQPDLVICQTIERFLGRLPES